MEASDSDDDCDSTREKSMTTQELVTALESKGALIVTKHPWDLFLLRVASVHDVNMWVVEPYERGGHDSCTTSMQAIIAS